MKDKLVPTLVAWVLYDATTDVKYIRMSPFDGSLAIFDTEEAAKSAKRLNSGTDYARCEYYSAPQPSTKCPGASCMDQGCPAHYAAPQPEPEVAKLVEALRLAKEMLIANAMSLPHTFEVIDEALEAYNHGGES